jgi:hypothetical protein
MIEKVAFVLLAVFADMSRFTAFATCDTRDFGREIWSGNESGSECSKLFVPFNTIYEIC